MTGNLASFYLRPVALSQSGTKVFYGKTGGSPLLFFVFVYYVEVDEIVGEIEVVDVEVEPVDEDDVDPLSDDDEAV